MRKLFYVLVTLVLLFPVNVRAQEAEPVDSSPVEQQVLERPSGWIPNPDSMFFGLQLAWMRVAENIERVTANTEEKKAELEIKYLEKEAWLTEKMQTASEKNPELEAKYQEHLVQLKERYENRINRLDEKIGKFGQIEDKVDQRREEWVKRMRERREHLLNTPAGERLLEREREEIREQERLRLESPVPSGSPLMMRNGQ